MLIRYSRLMMLLILVFVSSGVLAQTTVMISGTVTDAEGNPVAGVEVFLGILSDPFQRMYTCTDAQGQYEFTGVPDDIALISAVGPAVWEAADCENTYFVADDGTPYVVQYNNGVGRPDAIVPFMAADSPLDYQLATWETNSDTGLNRLIVGAHRMLHEDFELGDNVRMYRRMELLIFGVELLRDRGSLSPERATMLIGHAEDYLTIGR